MVKILFFFLKGKIEKNGNTKRDKKSRFAKILVPLLFEESDEFHYSFVIR